MVNGYWVEIAPNDYLNTVTTEYNGATRSTGVCRLCVKESWDKKWHMGTSALVGYYTEFDFHNTQVSFTRLSAGTKLEVVAGTRPDRVLGLSIFTVVVLSSAIAFVMTCFVLLVMAVYCDFNIITKLFGGAQASKKTAKAEIVNSNELSLDNLE